MTFSTHEVDYLAMVAEALAAEAEIEPREIQPETELVAIEGIESVQIVRAVVRIEDACGIAVPDDFLFETATVRDLAVLVAGLAGADR